MMTSLAIPVDLIEIGCSVKVQNSDRTDADMPSVLGGVVHDIATHVDADTGEIMRKFLTVEVWRGDLRFDAIPADTVQETYPPNARTLWAVIKKAADLVNKSSRYGSNQARLIRLQNQLMEVL